MQTSTFHLIRQAGGIHRRGSSCAYDTNSCAQERQSRSVGSCARFISGIFGLEVTLRLLQRIPELLELSWSVKL